MNAPPINPNSINESDFLEHSLNYKNIYVKISNLLNENSLGPKDRVSKLSFTPESLRSQFYDKLRESNLICNNVIPTVHIMTLENALKNKINFVEYHITQDDLSKDLSFETLYYKLNKLIESGQVDLNQKINNLKYASKKVKRNFYASVQLLELSKNKDPSSVTIRQVVNSLSKFINYTYTHSHSIRINDFTADSLKCENLYYKISNFIASNENLNKSSKVGLLIFEPESLRRDFYSILKVLHGGRREPERLGTVLKTLKVQMDMHNSI